jgi:hypothetical protein
MTGALRSETPGASSRTRELSLGVRDALAVYRNHPCACALDAAMRDERLCACTYSHSRPRTLAHAVRPRPPPMWPFAAGFCLPAHAFPPLVYVFLRAAPSPPPLPPQRVRCGDPSAVVIASTAVVIVAGRCGRGAWLPSCRPPGACQPGVARVSSGAGAFRSVGPAWPAGNSWGGPS